MQRAIKRSLVVFMSVCFLRTVTLSCDGELLRHGYYIISILTAPPIFNILMNCGSIFSVQNRPNNLLLNSLRLQSIYELSPFSIVNTILQQLTYWTSVNSVLGGPWGQAHNWSTVVWRLGVSIRLSLLIASWTIAQIHNESVATGEVQPSTAT